MKSNELTAEVFFQKYLRNQEKLKELEYRLACLDDVVIQTTQYRQDKVQTTARNHIDQRVYNRKELKERLEWDIQWIKFDIGHAEMVMAQIGDKEQYRISYLKRRYLDKHSYNKIATNYGLSVSKVKRIMKETEELLCYLAR
ncbi:MAG: hypothetical protein K2G70_02390 [Turicibacter sp.]|nr:hypothetical protein [Turicibacter sp.]